jgi:hypothetical protein
MKKLLTVFTVIALVPVLIGADFRGEVSVAAPTVVVKKKCLGYTIIEFGKGIDCNGDTIKLAKVRGGQELARALQQESEIALP